MKWLALLLILFRLDTAYYGWQVGARVGRVEIVARAHRAFEVVVFLDGQAL